MTLESMKKALLSILEQLEAAGMVSYENDYQEIANAIAKDVRNQHAYRAKRKTEIEKLKKTHTSLLSKKTFFNSQKEAYDKYLEGCMSSMVKGTNKGTSSVSFKSLLSRSKKSEHTHGEYSCSAKKLKEKWGVLLDVEGVPTAMLATIRLTITSDEEGVFVFTVAPQVADVEPVVWKLSELLELQYEGRTILKMFTPTARINVNLLLFLLNRKFFNK